jgi:hypothetical protein
MQIQNHILLKTPMKSPDNFRRDNIAGSHSTICLTKLLTLLRSGSEWPFDQAQLLTYSRYARKLYHPKMKRIFEITQAGVEKILCNLGLHNFLSYLECITSYAWSKGHSDPDLSSVLEL